MIVDSGPFFHAFVCKGILLCGGIFAAPPYPMRITFLYGSLGRHSLFAAGWVLFPPDISDQKADQQPHQCGADPAKALAGERDPGVRQPDHRVQMQGSTHAFGQRPEKVKGRRCRCKAGRPLQDHTVVVERLPAQRQ